jgi:hypothetical protein
LVVLEGQGIDVILEIN